MKRVTGSQAVTYVPSSSQTLSTSLGPASTFTPCPVAEFQISPHLPRIYSSHWPSGQWGQTMQKEKGGGGGGAGLQAHISHRLLGPWTRTHTYRRTQKG